LEQRSLGSCRIRVDAKKYIGVVVDVVRIQMERICDEVAYAVTI